MSPSPLVLPRRKLPRCVHGGDVWGASRLLGVSVNEVLDFSSNANPLGPPPAVLKALTGNYLDIRFYPDPEALSLRELIASQVGVSSANVVVGRGVTELIYLFAELFSKRGEAVIAAPTYGEYEAAVKRFGGKPVCVYLKGLTSLDADALVKSMGKRVKTLFLCNPNNPTGSLAPAKTLLELVEAALDKGVYVFLDESFVEFTDQPLAHTLVKEAVKLPNLVVLRSLTKPYGMPGVRVGYGVAAAGVAKLLLRARMPWGISLLDQVVSSAALLNPEHVERARQLVKGERPLMFEGLSSIDGFKPLSSSANFILVNVEGCGLTASRLKRRALRRRVLIRDCSTFKGLNRFYVRLSIRSRSENELCLEALRRAVERVCG